ncbi:MAG: hypothetical protein U5K69_29770 [Balneolaceae bacterium]|nr:hypothetical protein [Balneolaceae bacterium]
MGVQRAESRDMLIEAIETAFRYDANLLVEKAISPLMEINCAVLGDPEEARTSICERPLGKEETLSFEDKYQSDAASGKGMASADREIPAEYFRGAYRQDSTNGPFHFQAVPRGRWWPASIFLSMLIPKKFTLMRLTPYPALSRFISGRRVTSRSWN